MSHGTHSLTASESLQLAAGAATNSCVIAAPTDAKGQAAA